MVVLLVFFLRKKLIFYSFFFLDEIFNKRFTEFSSRRGVVEFLLNIILNTKEHGIRRLCHCQKITNVIL